MFKSSASELSTTSIGNCAGVAAFGCTTRLSITSIDNCGNATFERVTRFSAVSIDVRDGASFSASGVKTATFP